eukprot:10126977-Lingulodinium_polyedra.AAC.1
MANSNSETARGPRKGQSSNLAATAASSAPCNERCRLPPGPATKGGRAGPGQARSASRAAA